MIFGHLKERGSSWPRLKQSQHPTALEGKHECNALIAAGELSHTDIGTARRRSPRPGYSSASASNQAGTSGSPRKIARSSFSVIAQRCSQVMPPLPV